jgi:hypothetical protein
MIMPAEGYRDPEVPMYAKNMQYRAANIGSGMDANIAPNFPG